MNICIKYAEYIRLTDFKKSPLAFGLLIQGDAKKR